MKADAPADDLLSLAHVSIIEQPQLSQISRDFWARSETRQPTTAPTILKTSSARVAAIMSEGESEATEHPSHDVHIHWQKLFANRRSSVRSNASRMSDIRDDDHDDDDAAPSRTFENHRQDLATWRQLFSRQHHHDDHQPDDL